MSEDLYLQEVLRKMRGKPFLLVWDIIQGIGLFAMLLIVVGGWRNFEHKLALAGTLALSVGYQVAVHMLIKYYYNTRNYIGKLIETTRKYYDYDNEQAFLEYVAQSLKDKTVFKMGQLILTEDLILGYAEGDLVFKPAAIPRSEIVESKFHIKYAFGNAPNRGVLRCRLKNKKTMDLYIAIGATGINGMRELLRQYNFECK